MQLLAKIDHRNLVKLLGYIDKGNERLLITEYVPNGTLREHLDGKTYNVLSQCLYSDMKTKMEYHFDIAGGRFAWENPGFQSTPSNCN